MVYHKSVIQNYVFLSKEFIMPIFEFKCKDCNHQFEELFLSADDSVSLCPKCGKGNVEKLMSAGSFRAEGIPTGSGGFDGPACGGSMPGG